MNSTAFLIRGIYTELLQRLRDRWQMAIWIGIPLLLGVLITLVSGGDSGPKPVARLIIADEDQSFLSQLVVGSFSQGGFADLVDAELADRATGEQIMADGEASGLLIIPAGFADAAVKDEAVELTLITNPSQNILPKILSEGTGILVDAAFYAQRLFGAEIKAILDSASDAGDGPSDDTVADISVSINQHMQAIGKFVFPPVITLNSSVDEQPDAQQVSYAFLFFPGVLVMSLLFMAQSISSDFWKARQQGTLRRLAITPQRPLVYLTAKTMAVFAFLIVVTTVLAALGFYYHSVGIGKLPLGVLWLACSGVLLFAIMSVIQLFSPSQKSASLITGILVFPLAMAGGSFFPFEAMPGWLAGLGRLSPNGYANRVFKEYLLERIGPGELGINLLILLSVSLVLLGVVALRLRAFAKAAT